VGNQGVVAVPDGSRHPVGTFTLGDLPSLLAKKLTERAKRISPAQKRDFLPWGSSSPVWPFHTQSLNAISLNIVLNGER
jgi:hypothetical protein